MEEDVKKPLIKLGLAMPCDRFVSTRTFLSFDALKSACDDSKNIENGKRDYEFQYLITDGKPIDYSRNRLVENFLYSGVDWILFVDSDQTFDYQMVERLFDVIDEVKKKTDEDIFIIGPMNYQAFPPFRLSARLLDSKSGTYSYINSLDNVNEFGLQEVDMLGTGVLLVHTSVFHKIKDEGLAPQNHWFEFWHDPESKQLFGEDMMFCRKAKQCNYKIYLDTLNRKVRHITPHGIGYEAFEYNMMKFKELENYKAGMKDLKDKMVEDTKFDALEEFNDEHEVK